MKAYITSVGEPTTQLCDWALKRNGWNVELLFDGNTSLADKLEFIYETATEDFLRVDADVIVNRFCTPDFIKEQMDKQPDTWWLQFQCWGWYGQQPIYGGVQFIKIEALEALRSNIKRFKHTSRPETAISRINEFYNPRRFQSVDTLLGIHGYGIKDLKPIIIQKANRGQSSNYDFELAKRLNEL